MLASQIIPRRVTATLDGTFCVFLIGMRFNKPWKIHQWLPVFIAMPRMRVVQVPVHHVIRVIAVRDRVVPATRPVDVVLAVASAVVGGRAVGRVLPADREGVVVDVVAVDVVQVAVVEEILVPIVLDLLVAAIRAVDVVVVLVGLVIRHAVPPRGLRVSRRECRAGARGHGLRPHARARCG